eukprot:Rhum_TRINITY_DN8674_c1_g1::Rhum_TRINITY_DN8674_c1_g1_i1::g.29301::m.29301
MPSLHLLLPFVSVVANSLRSSLLPLFFSLPPPPTPRFHSLCSSPQLHGAGSFLQPCSAAFVAVCTNSQMRVRASSAGILLRSLLSIFSGYRPGTLGCSRSSSGSCSKNLCWNAASIDIRSSGQYSSIAERRRHSASEQPSGFSTEIMHPASHNASRTERIGSSLICRRRRSLLTLSTMWSGGGPITCASLARYSCGTPFCEKMSGSAAISSHMKQATPHISAACPPAPGAPRVPCSITWCALPAECLWESSSTWHRPSGGMYDMVVTRGMRVVGSSLAVFTSRPEPKSQMASRMSTSAPLAPQRMRRFSGLMSRWMKPEACTACRPKSSCCVRQQRRSSVSVSTKSASRSAAFRLRSNSSMARYTLLNEARLASGSTKKSKSRTMFGCAVSLKWCRSSSSRSVPLCRPSLKMSVHFFTATLRPVRVLTAAATQPKAPLPNPAVASSIS